MLGIADTMQGPLALTFDTTISVGNILGALAIAAVLFIARRFYDALTKHVRGVHQTMEIVDEHTDALRTAGLGESRWPYVGERRNLARRFEDRA